MHSLDLLQPGCCYMIDSQDSGYSTIELIQFHNATQPTMRRDTIFYKLFQTNPTLLFDLLGTAPTHAAQLIYQCYRSDPP
ncbi:DUF2887 domain-containing protein [Alkalinema pantanalense CENA528]|uniref:DUF2887 domain-containing protein n=1 Tax=Alkalinema pantanalense TaxID=1620705 RepID=UPI003D6FCC86